MVSQNNAPNLRLEVQYYNCGNMHEFQTSFSNFALNIARKVGSVVTKMTMSQKNKLTLVLPSRISPIVGITLIPNRCVRKGAFSTSNLMKRVSKCD